MRILNVGSGPDTTGDTLDINPEVNPTFCMDALDLESKAEELGIRDYEMVVCEHNLEHFYIHDVPQVLRGFRKVLKPGGALKIEAPNVYKVVQDMLNRGLDISDTFYRVGLKTVTYHDVLYGWGCMMKKGNLYYAHKCGFTMTSLYLIVEEAGFLNINLTEKNENMVLTAVCP